MTVGRQKSREAMPPDAAVGSTFAGKYRVLSVLGQGGMGEVFEAEHVYTKRVGALKVLNRECAAQPAIVERFIREASAAGRIGSPHIVEAVDAGISQEGVPYLFMELLSGLSLEDLMKQRGKLSVAEAVQLVAQAAAGLAAAHAAQIIHRDIKPANLFVLDPHGTRRVKLLDFGISKFAAGDTGSGLTQTGSVMGTPSYMSFEQLVSSNNVDERSDVYSLGVVFYECLTGRLPFYGETLVGLSLAVQRGEFAAPCSLRSDIPAELDLLIQRCLAPVPGQRPQGMRAFLDALTPFLKEPALDLSAQLPPRTEGRAMAEATLMAAPTQRFEAPQAAGLPRGPQHGPQPEQPFGKSTTAALSSVAPLPAASSGLPLPRLLGFSAAVLVVVAVGYRVLRAPSSESKLVQESTASVSLALPSGAPSSGKIGATAAQDGAPSALTSAPLSGVAAEALEPRRSVNAPAAASIPLGAVHAHVGPTPGKAHAGDPAEPPPNVTKPAPVVVVPAAQALEKEPPRRHQRCARLVERQSLGEVLGPAERAFLRRECGAR